MKIQVYKIESDCGTGYFTHSLDDIKAELEGYSIDESTDVEFKITITTMDKEKYENLPEFEGF